MGFFTPVKKDKEVKDLHGDEPRKDPPRTPSPFDYMQSESFQKAARTNAMMAEISSTHKKLSEVALVLGAARLQSSPYEADHPEAFWKTMYSIAESYLDVTNKMYDKISEDTRKRYQNLEGDKK